MQGSSIAVMQTARNGRATKVSGQHVGEFGTNIFIDLAGIYLLWLAVFGFAKRSRFFRCSVRPHLPHDVAARPCRSPEKRPWLIHADVANAVT